MEYIQSRKPLSAVFLCCFVCAAMLADQLRSYDLDVWCKLSFCVFCLSVCLYLFGSSLHKLLRFAWLVLTHLCLLTCVAALLLSYPQTAQLYSTVFSSLAGWSARLYTIKDEL